ncbi:MAG: hypothetical protein NCW75_14300 [Phycisphaera sp.]|nr:MAG: hypothetical protein NCW75_14300 [Phycisphaera sp.]
MDQKELIGARIRDLNGNVRLMLALLVGWVGLYWWINVSALTSFMFSAVQMRDMAMYSDSEVWIQPVLPIVMALIGIVTAGVSVAMLVAIGSKAGEMRSLSTTLANNSTGLVAGTAERSVYLKAAWPVVTLVICIGLSAFGALLMSATWLAMIAQVLPKQ